MARTRDSAVWRKARGILLAASLASAGLPIPVAAPAKAFEAPEAFDPYVVRDIAVSAVAEDAVIAKKRAIDEALVTSAKRVLARVAVDPGGLEIEADEAERLLSTLENSAERFGPGGYAATLTLGFDRLLVRGLLARRGVDVVDEAAPPVLLIPVVAEEGGAAWMGCRR